MEYSLQIDLAICLNTEYVWTKRTKIAKQIFICFAIFIVLGCRDSNTSVQILSKAKKFGRKVQWTFQY